MNYKKPHYLKNKNVQFLHVALPDHVNGHVYQLVHLCTRTRTCRIIVLLHEKMNPCHDEKCTIDVSGC